MVIIKAKQLTGFIITLLLIFFLLSGNGHAEISGTGELKIDFTNKDDATTKATWSEPDKINVTKDGLGWNGEQTSSYDFWIQTTFLAVGLSWRTAQSVNVTVELEPELKPVELNKGTTSWPYLGNMFVRYGPEGKHWSSWQAMDYPKPQGKEPVFTALVSVPRVERNEYASYMKKYWKLDVPWISDEEALVKWILQREPNFFEKHIPFIGYLQFLYETSLPGGQRITRFRATARFDLGGTHQPPKDKNVYKERDNIPWRFREIASEAVVSDFDMGD